MIPRRIGHAPCGGIGMLALEILKDHARELDMFGFPLGLGKYDPVERALHAFFESLREKRMGMAKKSNFAGGETELFPHQTHQTVTVRATGRVPMSAGGEDQADVLRGLGVGRDGAGNLIGQSLDHQGMGGVDIVVMNGELRMRTPSFTDGLSESFALQQIEIQSGREYENFSRVAAANCSGQVFDGSQFNLRSETEDWGTSRGDQAGVPALEVADENERGSQRSFPPIRPCLVMEASTSTIARTATSAVMSEMS